ncbi:Alpha/Beta hydrolase protein [Sporodiniella umbellata]|nr:Alpha/Beta hydrolase protein [Sporodiniella umbellata]
MVKYWGNYDCEQHIVPTKDDYFLCVHRIPSMKDPHKKTQRYSFKEKIETLNNMDQFVFEKKPKSFGYTGKPVVLLYHGFLMSSEVWVSNIDEHSNLPFILAQHGYDVWLGNARGNKYSQYHLHLNPEDPKFWNFSMNEFAMRDLPDTVDYILEQTGAPNLTYIGFSQGTAQAFAGLSINPSLNKKINLFIALAPATTPKGLRHPIIDAFVKATPNVIYLVFGRKAALKLALFWQRIISPSLFTKVIDSCCYFLFGWTGNNMSPAQKAVSYQHLYSTTSVKSLVHWFQIIRCGKFQMYDEVPSRLPYHTMNAVAGHHRPRFPTLQIKSPIAIFYGRSDSLVDFNILSADLPSPLAYVKSIEKWEHLDFLWADKIEEIVYQDILQLLKKFNPNLNSPTSQKEGVKNDNDSQVSAVDE